MKKWAIKFVISVLCTILASLIYYLAPKLQIRCSWGSNKFYDGIIVANVVTVQDSLKQATAQLEKLLIQHSYVIAKIRRSGFFSDFSFLLESLPPDLLLDGQIRTEEYENLRRRIYSNTKELGHYMTYKFIMAMYEDQKTEKMQAVLKEVAERKRSLLSDQEKLFDLDAYQEWRRKEAASVSDLVQRRLHYLQHPTNCRRARKVICPMDSCGFGCQHHHMVFCLIYAYASRRTLLLSTNRWRYNKVKGWEYIFRPISDTCVSTYREKLFEFPVRGDPKVIFLKPVRYVHKYWGLMDFLPYQMPKDLAKRIVRFNGDPFSWWIGQLVKYIMRPQRRIQELINRTITQLGFRSPVVGIHVRRTDKVGVEAEFYNISEYMSHVDEYYAQLELTRTIDERRVYLATDDPHVLKEAPAKYPQYIIFSNISTVEWASTSTRNSPESLTGLLVDLYLLSMCDYVVCTFSSNVCRLVYELMQNNRVDASNSIHSLDHIYYLINEEPYYRTAVMRHVGGPNDASFEIGDLIEVNTFCTTTDVGTVLRKNATDLIPWYKTSPKILFLHSFPEYQEVPIYLNISKM